MSDQPLIVTPCTNEYSRKKLSKVFSDGAKRGMFAEDNVFLGYLSDNLMESSVKIAQLWKEELIASENQKTNDLVFIQSDRNGVEHFAFLRTALEENFTHISSDNESPTKVTQNNLPSAA